MTGMSANSCPPKQMNDARSILASKKKVRAAQRSHRLVRATKLSDADKDKVLYGNVAKLFWIA